MPRAGTTRPYRPMPHDFAETFERVGWEVIVEECRTLRGTVQRWIAEYDAAAAAEGRPLLRERRRAWLERHYATTMPGRRIRGWTPGKARRYVLGRTLAPVEGSSESAERGGGCGADDRASC